MFHRERVGSHMVFARGLGLFAGILAVFPALAQINPSPPVAVNPPGASETAFDYSPALAADNGGTWGAAYASSEFINSLDYYFDIFFVRSFNGGASWAAPVRISATGAPDPVIDGYPALATGGAGTWIAVWVSAQSFTRQNTDADIYFARSVDAGASWSAPALLNSNGPLDTGEDMRPAIATDGAGNWVVVWESTENLGGAGADLDILVSRSADDGASWSAPAALNTNASADRNGDLAPAITTDGAGNWVAVWRSFEPIAGSGRDSDILVARSANAGATWTAPALLNTNATSDQAQDQAPYVVTDKAGTWLAVWAFQFDKEDAKAEPGNGLFVARSLDNGATWSAPFLLNNGEDANPGGDAAPRIATDETGNWVAVWASGVDFGGSGADSDLYAARSTDRGLTWTPPVLLNSNGNADQANDQTPQVATDRNGGWVALWTVDNTRVKATGPGDGIWACRFDLAVLGSLRGAVLSGELVVTCATVRARNTQTGEVFVSAVDPNGFYFIQAPAGPYTVTAFAQGVDPRTATVNVSARQETTLHFSLDPSLSETGVNGAVLDEESGNAIVSARIAARFEGQLLAETFTCADGTYELRFDLPAGKQAASVNLQFEANGYEDEEQVVPVTAGQVSAQSASLQKTSIGAAFIVGVVNDASNGNPVGGATVEFNGPIHISATTAADGSYSSPALPDGSYQVSAGATGYQQGGPNLKTVAGLDIVEAGFSLQPIPQVPELSVSPLSANRSNDAGSVSIQVVNLGGGTLNWSASETCDWVDVTPSSGSRGAGQGQTVTVNFAFNSAQTQRVCQITFTAAGASASPKTFTLTQAAIPPQPVISVAPTGRGVSAPAGSTTFVVRNTGAGVMNWSASWPCDWITSLAPSASALGAGQEVTVTVNFTENTTTSSRDCIITFTAAGATGSPRTVTVTQTGRGGGGCPPAAKSLRRAVFEEVMPPALVVGAPAPAGMVEPLAVRLRAAAAIDPATVWGSLEAEGWASDAVAWRVTDTGAPSDGWVVFTPAQPLPMGAVITFSAGAVTVSGEAVGPVTKVFEVAYERDELADGGVYLAEEPGVAPLPELLAAPKSPVYRIGPAAVYESPADVEIPVPAGESAANLTIYYYSESADQAGWYEGGSVAGWLVPGSRAVIERDGAAYLRFEVNHGGVLQLGKTLTIDLGAVGALDVGAQGGALWWLALAAALLALAGLMPRVARAARRLRRT